MPFPYRYRAYGLTIQADRVLPVLASADDAPADVTVTFLGHRASLGSDTSGMLVYPKTHPDRTLLRVWRTTDGGLRLTAAHRDEYCTFVVGPGGTQVRVAWSSVTPLQDVILYLLGPVLGTVLRLRGAICLHGSAVAYRGQAIVLIGSKGAGKSTTAAALMERGCTMLTDDVAVISEAGGRFYVQPGYPGMRLRASPAAHLYGAGEALPGLWSDAPDREHVQRRYLDLKDQAGRFSTHALPLAAVYLLDARDAAGTHPRVHPMPRMQGLLTLAANAYVDYALTEESRAHEWRSLEHMLRVVPARRLLRSEGLDTLGVICDVLLDDLCTGQLKDGEVYDRHPAPTEQP